IAAELGHQAGRQTVIMIRASWLHVRVIEVESKVNESGLRLIIPLALIVPEFTRSRLERHAVDRDAEPRAPGLARCGVRLRICWNMKVIILRGNPIWISATGKLSGRVVG